MEKIYNRARECLEAGGVALGVGLRHTRNVEIARLMKGAGFDWFFVDLEHNSMSTETAQQICCAGLDAGITPLIRVPESDHDLAARLLTGGALGTIMPHVETAADAALIVDRQKFAPLGSRAVSGPMIHFEFAPTPFREMNAELNQRSLVVVMLESKTAVANAAEIAAVRGVDVLMIGTGDLSTALDVPGDAGHELVRSAYRSVIEACRRHGKWAGCGGIQQQEIVADYIDMGVRFVLTTNDTNLLRAAAASRVDFLRRATARLSATSS